MRNPSFTHRLIAPAAIAFLGVVLLAPATEAEPQAARSRSSASSSSDSSSGGSTVSRSSAPSAGPSRSSSSRGAAVTRSSGRFPAAGPRTRVSGISTHRTGGPGHRHPYYGHYFYGPYHGFPYYGYYPYSPWGWSFGLGWWGGYFYGPYWGYSSPYYYSPYRAPEAAHVYADPVGAFDLNVKPKRTEVWVDGHYVGTTGRYDGFPDYLWLDEGKHQLIFYLEGHETVVREVESMAGVVVDLRLKMGEGRAIPPRQLAVKPPPPAVRTPREPAVAAPGEPKTGSGAAAGATAESLDLRPAPGRLVLSVEPEDASVYLDGRYLGTGRDLARLHAGLLIDSGEHLLEIVRPGYQDRAIAFSVGAGEEERIEIGLEASPTL